MIRNELSSVEAIIERDRAREVLRGMRPTLIANVFVSVSLGGMMWELVPRALILAFVGVNALLNFSRALIAARWLRLSHADRYPDRVLAFAWIGALLSGLCWAGALIGLAQNGHTQSVAVALAFCSLNAGVIQSKVSRAPAIAFMLPSLSVLTVLFLVEGSLSAQIIAVNLIILAVLMIRGATDQEAHYLESSRLKLEATALAESLKAANLAAEQALRRLEYSASHDHLTGLFNRAAYQAAFEARLGNGAADREEFWILLIDLDRFKGINDTFGHAVGDAVLVESGARLRRILGAEAVVARLGGDEFAALVPGPPGRDDGPRLAREIVAQLAVLVTASGQTVQAGASVGIARYPGDADTLVDLQCHADLALYVAKSKGRGAWCRYEEAMYRVARIKREIERDLAGALESRAIRAWFQPQVESRTGAVVGVEALLRWNHPKLGWVSPPDVIAAALATRQSRAVMQVILRDGCRMAQQLDAAGHSHVRVSINMSPSEFGSYPLAAMVAAELAAHQVAPARLAIEITEEAVYSSERGGADVEALIGMGVGIIVDDFGVAYSSIGALRNLRFDCLKIDRSFIKNLVDEERDRLLMKAILAFARTLGVTVVAEGVETRAQFDILKQLGCPILQGFHFAGAMPEPAALDWVAHNAALRFGLSRDEGWFVTGRRRLAVQA
ncbi:hypothetical protein ASF60_09580 [Methylobacterium sp. Leaf113]|uniref:putative bifunctional diguanylate cyclase/phosphodiesterase n=1 Tax=Methylobacterium sp. Leaf113 TaxID=1736259 RepID=UPI0006F84F05|nr:EAL domain-containing protein [Methylobacterium sp. Leaf113]KQP73678.1 hypothetical protein ASF60_09580 [Methylobacterium sp. Leaf113]